jgi:Uncharacterised nucleotidyltransferase
MMSGVAPAYEAEVRALVEGGRLAPEREAAFVAWARGQGLTGLADRAIVEGRWQPAEDVRDFARSIRGGAALNAALLRQELGPAAEALAAATGARPVVIKGPVLAERLYDAPGLRAFADLDLLVQRASLRDAVAALERCGWVPARTARSYAALGEPLPGFAEDYGHELHVVRRVGAAEVHLEVHWRVGDDPLSSRLDHARLSARARPLPGLGDHVLAPAPADELLVLAVHLIGHGRGARLIWHVDLALASRALDEAEWEEAFAVADELGLGWALHRALDRAEATTGVARPRPRACPPPPPWGPLRAADALPPRVAEHAGRLASLGWGGRARYVGRIALASARRVRARHGHGSRTSPAASGSSTQNSS